MLGQNADKSELEAWTLIDEKLMYTQGQLSDEYQSDAILRNQLMRFADIA